ncbi:MAG: GNAT family N-acetyltransferase [Nanoarchaeota archaeon]|nr:GNAT family N-acetyltransferase [Nanoarchaeota archaeon]
MFLGIYDCFDCEVPEIILEQLALFTELCYLRNNDGSYLTEVIDEVLPQNIDMDFLHAKHDENSIFLYNQNVISALRLQERSTFRINPIYVHPDAQGQGLGTYVVKLWEKIAKGLGGEKIVIQSSLFKETLYFWHKSGYRDTRIKTSELDSGLPFSVQHMEIIL